METYTANRDRRIPEEEELVQTGNEDSPDNTNEPGSESVDRHQGVVGVGDGGSNLRVRGVILCVASMVRKET